MSYPHWTPEITTFYEKVLRPHECAVETQVEAWYRQMWRQRYLDFRTIPPAPPFQIQKIDSRTFFMGPFSVQVTGHGKTKGVTVSLPTGEQLWSFSVRALHLADVPALITPRIRRVAAIGDWSQYITLPASVQRVIGKRFQIVRGYYENSEYYFWKFRQFKWSEIKAETPTRD